MVERRSAPAGLRERKKACSRQALADAALRLCLERGFDTVTVAEIADAADVSVTTLFAYFPSKEALLFDLEPQVDAGLVHAVRNRPAGQDLLTALHEYLLTLPPWDPAAREQYQRFSTMVQNTPALASHWQRMWLGHADSLAQAIAADRGLPAPDIAARAAATFVVTAAVLAQGDPDPTAALAQAFRLLHQGIAES